MSLAAFNCSATSAVGSGLEKPINHPRLVSVMVAKSFTKGFHTLHPLSPKPVQPAPLRVCSAVVHHLRRSNRRAHSNNFDTAEATGKDSEGLLQRHVCVGTLCMASIHADVSSSVQFCLEVGPRPQAIHKPPAPLDKSEYKRLS